MAWSIISICPEGEQTESVAFITDAGIVIWSPLRRKRGALRLTIRGLDAMISAEAEAVSRLRLYAAARSIHVVLASGTR